MQTWLVILIVLALLAGAGAYLIHTEKTKQLAIGLIALGIVLSCYAFLSRVQRGTMGFGETVHNVSKEYFNTVQELGKSAIGAVQQNPELIGNIAQAVRA